MGELSDVIKVKIARGALAGMSLSAIKDQAGGSDPTIILFRRRLIANIAKRGDAVPDCSCGQYLGHPGNCNARTARIPMNGTYSDAELLKMLVPDGESIPAAEANAAPRPPKKKPTPQPAKKAKAATNGSRFAGTITDLETWADELKGQLEDVESAIETLERLQEVA